MLPSGLAVGVEFDYGPLMLGGLLSFGLSGCVSMQFLMYWKNCTDERWSIKSLAIVMWFLDLCHSTFVAIAIWDTIIASYGNKYSRNIIPWSVGLTVELTAMVTFLEQSFFAHRLYRLQKQKLTIAGPMFILSFIRLVAASVSTAEMIRLKSYTAFVQPFPSWVFTLGLSLSAFVDIVIMVFLCYFLRVNRSRIQSTNRILDTLTSWTVQNGSVTCFAAIASLVCWVTMPSNRIFLGLYFVVAKLYANSLLATLCPSSPLWDVNSSTFDSLNSRTKFRNSGKYSVDNPVPPPVGVADEQGDVIQELANSQRLRRHSTRLETYQLRPVDLGRSRSIEVKVQRTVESKYDDEIGVDIMSVTVESTRETEEQWTAI